MPNQRREELESLSTWVEPEVKEKLKRLQKLYGEGSMSDVVRKLIQDADETNNYRTKKDKTNGKD
jgi:predicted CopG family antitoxin